MWCSLQKTLQSVYELGKSGKTVLQVISSGINIQLHQQSFASD